VASLPGVKRLEVLQYVVYEKGMFCGWHQDNTGKDDHGGDRIVTGILQLSGPDDHDGGDLQILTVDESVIGAEDEESFTCPRDKGSVIFFAGDVVHRVTEVTKGTRRTVVCWGLK